MRRFLYLLYAFFLLSTIEATPDRYRVIVDNLIGFHAGNCVVYQVIYDNLGSHYENLVEQLLLEKRIENGETRIMKKIVITKEKDLAKLLSDTFGSQYEPAFPLIDEIHDKTIKVTDGRYFFNGERQIDLSFYVPKELAQCPVLRVVDLYRHDETMFLVVDMRNAVGSEFYRKVIEIPLELYEV
jgi:hypothetical protein